MYVLSLHLSCLIFLVSDAVKAFSLGAGVVVFRLLRREITGLVQRLAIGIRNLAVVPLWTAHFSGDDGSPKNVISLAYLIAKLFMHLWPLADFGIAFRDYRANAQDAFVPASQEEVAGDCIVCLDCPGDPVQFDCGHIVWKCACQRVAVNVKVKCPLCFA
jgi:hypothetical protein